MITLNPAAAFVIMVVAATLLGTSSAAPVHREAGQDPAAADSWWYNACGHHGILHAGHKKQNHSRSDIQIFKILRNQMKIFTGFFKKEYRQIMLVYKKVGSFKKLEREAFAWLPEYVEPAIKNRSKEVLKEFHGQLQYYVVALNYLVKLRVKTEAEFDFVKRDETLMKFFNQIKSLLCEIESGVNGTGQTITTRVPPDFPQRRNLTMEFDNLTQMCLHDIAVLNKLQQFTQMWRKNLMKRLPPIHKSESESDESGTTPESPEFESENFIDDE